VGNVTCSFEDIEATLKRSAAALRDAGIDFALAGSVAAWARGGPETTNDIDFLLRRDDAEQALEILTALGMRPERPPEGWLLKAWDGDVLVDLIFQPNGIPSIEEVLGRSERQRVAALDLEVVSLEDLVVMKLHAFDEHNLDFTSLLTIARALREQIDWGDVRARTSHSPYAAAFFVLLERLRVVSAAGDSAAHPTIRVVGEA